MTSRLKRCHFINRALTFVYVTAAVETTTNAARRQKAFSRAFSDRGDLTNPDRHFHWVLHLFWESLECYNEFLCRWVERSKSAQLVKTLEKDVCMNCASTCSVIYIDLYGQRGRRDRKAEESSNQKHAPLCSGSKYLAFAEQYLICE